MKPKLAPLRKRGGASKASRTSALARARCKLIVIGDSATISNHGFYARTIEHFERIGSYRTVWELS